MGKSKKQFTQPIKWREMDIENFQNIGIGELQITPEQILKTLSTLGLPVRVIEDNILRPEKSGVLEDIIKNGVSIKVIIRSMDPENSQRRSRHEIIFDEKRKFSLGLPIFA